MSKQFRLTMPDAEAEGIRKQSKAEGFDTPQKLILDRLRRFSELEAEISALKTKFDDELTNHREHEKEIVKQREEWRAKYENHQETSIEDIAITKTQEVLEVIKTERHELLMLYAFRSIFPSVPEAVVKVMTEYKLTPGVYYMHHVCERFPEYVEQIKNALKRAGVAEAENKKLKESVAKIQTEGDTAKKDAKAVSQQIKTVASYLGVPDTDEHIVDRIKELEQETENLQGIQASYNEQCENITKLAEQRTQLEYDCDFYKNQSWWQKLWESITGKETQPLPVPRSADDDEIPF